MDNTTGNRQVSSLGPRPDVSVFINNIQKQNLIDKTIPIVLNAFDPAWLFSLNLPMSQSKYFSDKGSDPYDIEQNTYLQNTYWEIFDMDKAILENNQGLIIARSSYTFSITERNVTIKELYKDQGFSIYKWQK